MFQNQIKISKHAEIGQLIGGTTKELYQRMKTVFGHAIIQDGCGTPVYNCKFDKLDKLIITGADDG